MDNRKRRRWRVKDSALAPWRELADEYTADEISQMRRKGAFSVAIPIEDEDRTGQQTAE